MLELVGYDRSSTPADYAGIIEVGDQLFPGAIDWDTARYRTGHGHVGWTMACVLADLIYARQPDIDPTTYSPIAQNRHP